MSDTTPSLIDRLTNGVFLGLMGLARLLPYERRIPAIGWFFSRVIAPVAGWRQRIRDNLAMARPDLDRAEVEALVRAVPDNAGRSLAEIYSGDEFTARIRERGVIEGPGLVALEQAFESQRPVILACAHFGNYDAMRAMLVARGWPVGALYRPMNNEAFNRHYVPAITAIAEPLFPRGRAGLAAMIRFLKGGGWLALGFDQYDRHATELRFFDLPTRTVLTPADLALRHDALLVPINGIRQPNGLDFRIHIGDPVEHGEPRDMMQALNDGLEMLIRRHMEQWFWIHRRWK
ncbi:KDO2-lipid IV(A) lauroyltransferase [Paracoccus alcaliphilus]|uniref:KDO2-lipid IV(A) lauroyltransferase n=1 Tax=Paracoccus alcaliphilus TaxID=34002 RepID=A0A1H8KWL3_9RHOB|nr:lysophospholipid acyltransferase family protein [Paracoccus alcaliphilus]WCR17621.1 lysophospholipid acyltransferase family protein [Paracoccus alcaliphilus]SEN96976.1 KDO2-lipid IV(A) lauroyltransferase [Paracoccus alcaliphilus]